MLIRPVCQGCISNRAFYEGYPRLSEWVTCTFHYKFYYTIILLRNHYHIKSIRFTKNYAGRENLHGNFSEIRNNISMGLLKIARMHWTQESGEYVY